MQELLTKPNPQRGEDCVLTFKIKDAFKQLEDSEVKFKYVPDRDIVTDGDFHTWVKDGLQKEWETVEAFAAEALKMFYDCVLPFHIQIEVSYKQPETKLKRKMFFVKTQPKHVLSEMVKEQL